MKKLLSLLAVFVFALCALPLSVFADVTSANIDGYGSYAADGSISTVIGDQEVIWLYEHSFDSNGGTWFGIDNSDGRFPEGSRLVIRKEWSSNQDAGADPASGPLLTGTNRHISGWSADIVDDDGREIDLSGKEPTIYIQLGDDWDTDDIEARFIDESGNEVMPNRIRRHHRHGSNTTPQAKSEMNEMKPRGRYRHLPCFFHICLHFTA